MTSILTAIILMCQVPSNSLGYSTVRAKQKECYKEMIKCIRDSSKVLDYAKLAECMEKDE